MPGFLRDRFGGPKYAYQRRLGTYKKLYKIKNKKINI